MRQRRATTGFLWEAMRQAKGEADRFRVTVAGRLSNIDEFGLFKEDEMYEVKGFFEAIEVYQ